MTTDIPRSLVIPAIKLGRCTVAQAEINCREVPATWLMIYEAWQLSRRLFWREKLAARELERAKL